jgi:hypothetical protein
LGSLTGRRWFEFWLFRVVSRVPSRAYFVGVVVCKVCCRGFVGLQGLYGLIIWVVCRVLLWVVVLGLCGCF